MSARFFHPSACTVDRSRVAVRAKSTYHSLRLVAQVAVKPERLPLVNICDVNLYEGNADSGQGVSNGKACVRVGPGVDDHVSDSFACFVDSVDNGAFVVRLECLQADGE